jgi:hypothetical protein
MVESWVTVARHEDVTEAEWEAALLIEKEIPAVVHDPGATGPVELRVLAKHAAAALQALGEENGGTESGASDAAREELEDPPPPPPSHRERDLDRAFTFALIGTFMPPAVGYAVWLVVRAWRAGGRGSLKDYLSTLWALLFVSLATVFWVGLVLGRLLR